MKRLLLLLVIFCQVMSCTTPSSPGIKKRETNGKVITLDLHERKSYLAFPDSLIEIVRYIKPEVTENSLIGNYDKIIACGDTIFILERSISQQCVFAFNYDGDFLFKLDARGRGPNEYQEIQDFYVDNKSKHIGILYFSKILKYNFNGDFIESLNFKEYNIRNLELRGNLLYTYKCPNCNNSKCNAFAVFDLNGNLIIDDFPVKKEILYYPYIKGNYLSSNSEKTYINLLNSDTIFEATKSGLLPKFVLDYGKYKLPDNDFREMLSKDPTYSFDYFQKNDYVRFGLHEFYITDKYLYLFYDKMGKATFAFYSLKTGKIKRYSGFYENYNILFGTNIKSLDGKLFYSTLTTSQVLQYKSKDEYDGILNPKENFPKARIEKYNFIKNTQQNDNELIILFKLKDF